MRRTTPRLSQYAQHSAIFTGANPTLRAIIRSSAGLFSCAYIKASRYAFTYSPGADAIYSDKNRFSTCVSYR